jgi:diacylglycerol O-acyltransferase / wax synthase
MAGPVLLGGIDVFHLANDRAMRSRGLAGNHCAFVVEVEGRLDRGALEARLAHAVRAVPELSWRLETPLLGRPRWVPDPKRPPPAVGLRSFARPDERLTAVEALLTERVGDDRPWALDIVRDPAADAAVFRWFHPLADAKAGERLVRWLGSGSGVIPDAPAPEAERFGVSERPIAALSRDERMALMRAYNSYIMELGRTPILSLERLSPGRAGAGATRIHRVELTLEETRAFDQRVRQRAKLAETSVMVIAAARVADAAMVRRGYAPPHHLVPVPLSLDPKVGATRMFGNHLTMMMFSLDRDDLRDEARAIARLAEQQRAVVRRKLDLGMIAALDFARYLPTAPYRWLSTRPFGGEMGSFIFSNPGAVTLERFAGLPVRDAYPVPTVVLPPGFQVIFTRFAGRLSGWIMTVDAVIEPGEARGMADELRAELLR